MIDLSKKTIVFDFGNVFINLHYDRFYKNFEDILDVKWDPRKMPDSIEKVVHKYDKGQTSDETLIWAFQNINPKADPRDIIKAWNSLIGIIPPERFEMLKMLKENYNLAILSNINNFHLRTIQKYLKVTFDITEFESTYFDQVFYSHLIGKRKPESNIYKYVNDTLGVRKETVVFIDDLKENVEGAQEFGWQAVVHNPKDEISNTIKGYLDKVGFLPVK